MIRKLFFALTLGAVSLAVVGQTIPDWFPKAPPLPSPTGQIVHASTAQQILTAAEQLAPGATLLIQPGVYKLDRPLVLRAKQNITIRSISGDPASVTLQGKGWDVGDDHDDIIHVGDCTNVLISGLTFAEARSYGVKVEAEHGPREINIFNCRFRNIGVRAIKGSAGNDPSVYAQRGSVRFCDFENDKVPPANWLFNGDYIAAIDMMALDNWRFSDNTFRNIKGRNGGGRAAIFIWVRSRHILVERNLILNCDRGIAFGNPGQSTANKPGEKLVYVADSSIQNNMITGGADCGIELWHVDGIKVWNNSIFRPQQNFGRGIRVDDTNNVAVAANLIHGGIQIEGGGPDPYSLSNIVGNVAEYFVKPTAGDLSLTTIGSKAIKQWAYGPCAYDIREMRRNSLSDYGAWDSHGVATDNWIEHMRKVHARFKGARGTLAQIGDSITFSGAYWSPLVSKPKNMTPRVEAKYDLVKNYLKPQCFNQKGPEFGNKGSMTVKWARENIATWLKTLNPEAVVIMFGSNDVKQMQADEYATAIREVIAACVDNGTIPILTTPPPQTAHLRELIFFADVIREIATDLQLPLIDYSNEIFERRHFDWDGSSPEFKDVPGDTYEVPTLISRDGVHPSNTHAYVNDFSDIALEKNGFTLRNYLTLMTYAEVIHETLQQSK